ncbi:probable pectate lyase 8 [Amborella trichopoda]|uniref:Pectate lyase n=1 Tax=Amborella trichopoda TaxID=13333 RepID=W1NDI6_AMBTC|nr:probable pectate lyase 8 [Amborella trichopoda]ERM93592.1 hypothetical protein AMTR_s00004p00123190 [Amborella trichopoda]|eukprot:XP_006826355.1 probable pectate lyase 8 [Amborella trichopoda]
MEKLLARIILVIMAIAFILMIVRQYQSESRAKDERERERERERQASNGTSRYQVRSNLHYDSVLQTRAHRSLVDDSVLEARAHQSWLEAQAAYEPDPEAVSRNLTHLVHMELPSGNHMRRQLGRRWHGPCVATNPIDRCWRCDQKWHTNRKKLADCAMGFGQQALGGKYGRYYVVTDPSDNDLLNPKPGTLRHAVIQNEPLWIIFQRDMVIKLTEELMVNSFKTVDGRGANVHIAYGACITIQYVKNVIIHGLHIHDCKAGNGGMIRDSEDHFGIRTRSDGDGISIYGSTNVWVDHNTLSKCQDGLVDAIMGSTAITISNNHFSKHDEVLLLGGSDLYPMDKVMQVTVAFNHFGKGLSQRMPRCRFGYFHVVNNDYTHWGKYAIGGSMNPTILSQGNRFVAPLDPYFKEITKRFGPDLDWGSWNWKSEGDLFKNGAIFTQSGNGRKYERKISIRAKPGSYVGILTRFSGALKCKTGTPC